jgi:hypothetical protein
MKMTIKEMSFLVVMSLLLPQLRFDREVFDFGRIPRGKPVTTVFHFLNAGGAPLIIYSVEAGCGCTTTIFTREAIAPGHPGTITVTFDAARPGRFEKQIVVRSNAKTEVKVLYIRGEVVR